jgi:hypothetical protein
VQQNQAPVIIPPFSNLEQNQPVQLKSSIKLPPLLKLPSKVNQYESKIYHQI